MKIHIDALVLLLYSHCHFSLFSLLRSTLSLFPISIYLKDIQNLSMIWRFFLVNCEMKSSSILPYVVTSWIESGICSISSAMHRFFIFFATSATTHFCAPNQNSQKKTHKHRIKIHYSEHGICGFLPSRKFNKFFFVNCFSLHLYPTKLIEYIELITFHKRFRFFEAIHQRKMNNAQV